MVFVSRYTNRRLAAVLGAVTIGRPATTVRVRMIDNEQSSKSMSAHRRPSTSLRRMPVVANNTKATDKRCELATARKSRS